jgi:exosome complex exonuclease RRP6
LIKDGEYSSLTLAVEQLLEHADEQIEKHLGTGKHKKNANGGAVGAKSFEEMEEKEKSRQKVERLPARLLHDSTLPKPQISFTPRTKVQPAVNLEEEEEDARAIPLWKPILRNKVNSLNDVDAGEGWLQTEVYEPTSRFTPITDTKPPSYSRYLHPYKVELENLQAPQILLDTPSAPPAVIPKDSFENTPFEWVANKETLEKMVREIRAVGEEGFKELAIDLEHHDFRSWSGFTCLIQVCCCSLTSSNCSAYEAKQNLSLLLRPFS